MIDTIRRKIFAHSVVKNSAVLMAGSVVGNGLAYVYHLVMARILGPVQYGELGALISIYYIVNVPSGVIQNGLTKYFSILKARGDTGQAKQLYLTSITLLSVVSLMGFVVSLLIVRPLSRYLHIENHYTVLALYVSFATYFISVPMASVFGGFQKFVPMTVVANIGAVLRILYGAFAAYYGVFASICANIATNISTFLISLYPLRFLLKESTSPISVSRRKAVAYAAPMGVATLCATALYSFDVVMVKHYFSSFDAGLYSSLAVLGKIIFFASFALSSVMFPTIAERIEKGQTYKKMLFLGALFVAGVSSLITLLYFLFPAFTVQLLFGKSYEGAIEYLGLFGVFLSLVTVASYLTQSMLAAGETSVSYLLIAAAVSQILCISFFHDSIMSVIRVNIAVSAVLVVLLGLFSFRKAR